MKIGDLIYDVLVEEVKNKKLYNFLLNKWFGDTPSEENMAKTEELMNNFAEIVNQIAVDTPSMNSFLDRFDGQHGSEFFDRKNLKDITKYSLEQIKSVIGEYKDTEYAAEEAGGFSKNLKFTPENIEASENLWKSQENLIIDEGPLRVYKIDKQSTSMKYGYYQQLMAQRFGGNQWCVTARGRGNGSNMTNLWGNYRNTRTFYYVIDDRKKPADDASTDKYSTEFQNSGRYYLCALQVDSSNRTGYKMTSMVNDGDNDKAWQEVLSIYPELESHKDKLVSVRYDTKKELDIDDTIFNRITEQEGNPYEFRRMDRQIKKAYLNGGASIKQLRSWDSMDSALKSLYILITDATNYKDRFQSWAILNSIKQNALFSELDNRLKALKIKNGIGSIFANLMTKEFEASRESLDNPIYVLYESRNSHKFGIYNVRTAQWVSADGVTFEPVYNEIETEQYVDDSENNYIVETYSKSNEVEQDSFFCIFPITESNTEGGAHFVTFNKFQELSKRIHPKGEDDDYVKFSEFNPETDTDIKESIKRRK